MAFNIFGYRFSKVDTSKSPKGVERLTGPLPDGSSDYDIAAVEHNSYGFDFEVEIQKEAELIQTYRDIVKISDVGSAVDDIVNEAIVVERGQPIVTLTFQETTGFSKNIQDKIIEEFEDILNILDFNVDGHQMFRQWYIDGKQYYHKVVDKNDLTAGIIELNWLDPKRIKKIRENLTETNPVNNTTKVTGYREYYLYDPNKKTPKTGGYAQQQQILKLEPDSVAYASSGLIDLETGRALSYLHNAIKPANQLALMRDSLVVQRLSRAPERRVFYIDVGNLPKARAEQYMSNIISKYKNKLVYNTETGTVKANKHTLSMLEDIWLPRKEGGKGTEVSTLDGASNLGDIEDIVFLQKNLYKALNLPTSRMDTENVFNIGNNNEISRDEIKLGKFVRKLQTRFDRFFVDLLKTQLILKKKISETEWENEKNSLEFIYNIDSHFSEIKKNEMTSMRLGTLRDVDEYVGRYFSIKWVRKNVLNLTDEEIEEIDKEIKEEQDKGAKGESMDSAFGGMANAAATPEQPDEFEDEDVPPEEQTDGEENVDNAGGDEENDDVKPDEKPEKKVTNDAKDK